ncbi:hypothetical protein NQ314_000747 [Rhamnusium bicolor]|uniref:Uncharacterized protein n=1 Tax=Rhamnusium bicolor TaxID=1586634 RepID=A0AAV8ZTY2_9CUCU|nr:hypothetical protein NQ314_000747 [Rhamnusium bicolor]
MTFSETILFPFNMTPFSLNTGFQDSILIIKNSNNTYNFHPQQPKQHKIKVRLLKPPTINRIPTQKPGGCGA